MVWPAVKTNEMIDAMRSRTVAVINVQTITDSCLERVGRIDIGLVVEFGAGDRDRTGDIQLGKLTFYH